MKVKTPQLITLLAVFLCYQACDDGMYLSSKGTCVQCDISCNTCRSSDGCSTCYDQMYLIAEGNTIVCDVCYNVNKGCDVCITAAKCQSCSVGFYMQQDSTCASCSSLTPNCLLCFDGNSTRCISCELSFRLVNGVCVGNGSSSSSSALTTSSSGIISQSQPQDQSQGNDQQSYSDQNSQASTNGGCDPSQISINGACYPTIAFCQSYSQLDGTCISCASIFALSNGYCLPSTLISSSTSQPSQDVGTSQPSAAQPLSSPQIIYSPCTTRQFYSNGNCMDVGAECTQFDASTGACYECAAGFQAYNGLCVQTSDPSTVQAQTRSLPHCELVNPVDTTQCLSCVSGYTIVDEFPGVCYQIN